MYFFLFSIVLFSSHCFKVLLFSLQSHFSSSFHQCVDFLLNLLSFYTTNFLCHLFSSSFSCFPFSLQVSSFTVSFILPFLLNSFVIFPYYFTFPQLTHINHNYSSFLPSYILPAVLYSNFHNSF